MRRTPRALPAAALLAALLSSCAPARPAGDAAPAAGPVELPERGAAVRVETRAELLFDADPALSIREVSSEEGLAARGARFEPVGGRQVYVAPEAPVAWLRFRLEAKAGAPTQWVLEVAPSFAIILDRLELYLPRGDGSLERLEAGASLPRKPGDLRSRFFAFALPPDALRGDYCYLRLESRMAVEVKVEAWPALALGWRTALYGAGFGMIYGALCAMLLYNLFLFASLADRAYLHYVLYVGSGMLWQFWVQGQARALLGSRPGLDQALMWFFVGGTILWGGYFSLRFLAVGRERPLLFWPLAASMALGPATALAGLLGLGGLAFALSHAGGILVPALTIAVAAARLRGGFRPARDYLVGWAFLAAGGLAFTLMGLKVLPVSFWTVNGLALGMALQSVLLSMALGERVKELRSSKERLQRSQARYIELSLTDHLTGLYNKRYFESKLASEVEHALRIERPLSLAFLDLDDFKRINDGRGHPFGDAVLAGLGAALRETVREGDVACRCGGDEFVVLMPGAGLEEAARAAERLRAEVAASSLPRGDRRPVAVSLSVGVAALAPGEGPAELLARADDAMYRAKREGKGRVCRG